MTTIADQVRRMTEEINELQRTAYQRVACPRCLQPIGEKCVSMQKYSNRVIKHPHDERLRADGIYPR